MRLKVDPAGVAHHEARLPVFSPKRCCVGVAIGTAGVGTVEDLRPGRRRQRRRRVIGFEQLGSGLVSLGVVVTAVARHCAFTLVGAPPL
jgi:hypothetical protein